MRRDDLCDILDKMPPNDLTKTVLLLRFGTAITLDSVLRKEKEYLVARGREAGTNDDARAFFVPYDEILFVKLDRTVKLSDLQKMYGDAVSNEDESILDREADNTAEAKHAPQEKASLKDIASITPAPAMDPAAIAKQNLLARIRAARTAASG